MSVGPGVRRGLLAIACLLLLGLAWTGLNGGLNQFPQSSTAGQKAQTFAQFGYGLFALTSVVTAFRWRRWRRLTWACWIVTVTVAAGLAPIVWGGTSLASGLLAGLGALVIAVGIIWLLRAGARTLD